MKKFFYILLMSVTITLAVTSCTEEEVKPQSELNGGGTGADPIVK